MPFRDEVERLKKEIEKLEKQIARFQEKQVTEAPHATLIDCYREHERKTHERMENSGEVSYPPLGLARKIIEQCRKDPERKISYTELYVAYHGEEPTNRFFWKKIADQLFRLSKLCHAYGLPLVSILVVQDDDAKRCLSEDAKRAFFEDWRHKTPYIDATNPDEYAERMTELALKVTMADFERLGRRAA